MLCLVILYKKVNLLSLVEPPNSIGGLYRLCGISDMMFAAAVTSEEGADVPEVSDDVPSVAVMSADEVWARCSGECSKIYFLDLGWKTLHRYVVCIFQTYSLTKQ